MLHVQPKHAFFFTAMWLTLCGVLSLLVLVCFGLCLGESLTYLLVGGRLEGRGVLQFGRWCRHALFDMFGRKEIIDVSRIWRSL
jgi:hypothetical protein